MNDDIQLIDETLAGQSAAFGRLVTKYQDRLYNTLVHVTGCFDEARDVVQDAFVQAYTKLGTFQRQSAFYTWLYRIAFNVAIGRKRRRRAALSTDRQRDELGWEPVAHDGDPNEPLESAERVAMVRRAMDMLAEEFRTVLVLREIDGYCYETIAEMLELPIGTVRSRLHRARSELKQHLSVWIRDEH
ncbi:MAG: sigma-70 family RNA polymerase sigma factor [Pirellulales bacterium]